MEKPDIETGITKANIPGEDSRLRAIYAADGGGKAAFSSKVADYVASRPDYAPSLLTTLREQCGLTNGACIADVGAGTGILSRSLLESGCQVIAVEPNAAMRAAAETALAGRPGYRSVAGSAEAMPLAAGAVDLITAAQAFHWFDPEPARRECLRVLKPHGQVALIWNDRTADDPLQTVLDDLAARFGGAKRSAMVAQGERANLDVFFSGARWEEFAWPHEQHLTEAGMQSLVFSRSYIPARDSAEGRAIVDEVSRVFHQFAADDRISIRYETVLVLGRPEKGSGIATATGSAKAAA